MKQRPKTAQPEDRRMAGINDVVIKIATVNGTGSASANGLLRKAIFRMGVPVVGKNFFPSNIQGLPTWYEIRVTKDGYQARSDRLDIMVAMNAQTYARDMAEVAPGGCLINDSTWPRSKLLDREDINVIGIPLSRMCNETFDGARARILMKNIAYVGALAALLDIDLEIIKQLLEETFADKAHLIDSNMTAIHLGYDFREREFLMSARIKGRAAGQDERPHRYRWQHGGRARLHVCRRDRWRVVSDHAVDLAHGCVRQLLPPVPARRGIRQRTYCIIQAEDELAAIGMVLGAAWNGARAFTPTSGPGISLMSEFIGFAYYAEIPAVLFNVQRTGPSTGMPTRTQQADILPCAYASHGDTKNVLLVPG